MFKFLNNNLIAVFFSCSTLILLSAYFIEHVLGYEACNLCLIGRIPYFFVITFCLIFFFFKKFEKILLILIFISFISSTLIAFYHFGIEQGFFSESLICDLENSANLTKEQLLKQLKSSSIVSCKDVTFRVLGFSLATINTIISIILSAIMIGFIKNYVKN
jgi:disulfide bond formation protein DsbB